jgi:hypothetical protein
MTTLASDMKSTLFNQPPLIPYLVCNNQNRSLLKYTHGAGCGESCPGFFISGKAIYLLEK